MPKVATGAPGVARTPDLQIRSLPLYPSELQARSLECNTCRADIAIRIATWVRMGPISFEFDLLHRNVQSLAYFAQTFEQCSLSLPAG